MKIYLIRRNICFHLDRYWLNSRVVLPCNRFYPILGSLAWFPFFFRPILSWRRNCLSLLFVPSRNQCIHASRTSPSWMLWTGLLLPYWMPFNQTSSLPEVLAAPRSARVRANSMPRFLNESIYLEPGEEVEVTELPYRINIKKKRVRIAFPLRLLGLRLPPHRKARKLNSIPHATHLRLFHICSFLSPRSRQQK